MGVGGQQRPITCQHSLYTSPAQCKSWQATTTIVKIFLSIWTELVKIFYTSRLVSLRSRKIVLQSCSCIKVNFGPRGGSLTFSTAWGPQFRHKGVKFAPPLNMIFKALNGCQNKACILSCFHLTDSFIDPPTMTIHRIILRRLGAKSL